MTLRAKENADYSPAGTMRRMRETKKTREKLEALAKPKHVEGPNCLCADCVSAAIARDDAMRGDETMKRVNWLPAPHYFNLNMACMAVARALDALEVEGGHSGVYLVGSCTKRRDYRDVDVRGIIDDKSWERLFGSSDFNRPDLLPLWSVICTGISCWLSQQSGLPVDFQLQSATVANGSFSRKEGHDRQPLGVLIGPTPRDYAASEAAGDKAP